MTGERIHASAVALTGRGVVILGASGSGKSALALRLMAFGADLVADDVTELRATHDGLYARAPATLAGLIEARGIGLLAASPEPTARLVLAVDLDQTETARHPPWRETTLAGVGLPLLHKVDSPHFPAAILQYLKGGRAER